jgi:hypothetical protein
LSASADPIESFSSAEVVVRREPGVRDFASMKAEVVQLVDFARSVQI